MGKTTQVLDRIIAACIFGFVLSANFSISSTQIFGYAGAGLWLIQIILTRSWRQVETPLAWPFLLFVVGCLVSVATALDPWLSLVQLKKLLTISIFFWVVSFLSTAHAPESFSWWGRLLKLPAFQKNREAGPLATQSIINCMVDLLIITGAIAACYGLYQSYAIGGGGVQQRVFITGTRANLATFAWGGMVIGLVTLSRLLFQKHRGAWRMAALLFILTGVLLTYTRSAWLGFFVGLFFLLYFKKRIFKSRIFLINTERFSEFFLRLFKRFSEGICGMSLMKLKFL